MSISLGKLFLVKSISGLKLTFIISPFCFINLIVTPAGNCISLLSLTDNVNKELFDCIFLNTSNLISFVLHITILLLVAIIFLIILFTNNL